MADNLKPAEKLLGRELPDGWKVVEKIPRDLTKETGGRFSVGYVVERAERKAFLKALDLSAALAAKDKVAEQIFALTAEYLFERDILEVCGKERLSRIVQILGHGEITVDDSLPLGTGRVFYLIFELANADVRKHLAFAGRIDDIWKLRTLHEIAVGMQQLHTKGIAHQDVKPSNVLLFERFGTKLGDLGRSVSTARPSLHDGFSLVGDYGYAPPEALYGFRPTEWVDGRDASDLYLVGSMIVFLFTGQSMTSALIAHLAEDYRPRILKGKWAGSYQDALPYLLDAFDKAVNALRLAFPKEVAGDLEAAVRQMCHPEPKQRGHPEARASAGRPVGIDRYISLFNKLSYRIERSPAA